MKEIVIKLPEHLVEWLNEKPEGKDLFILGLIMNAFDEDYYSKWGDQKEECYMSTCDICGDNDC